MLSWLTGSKLPDGDEGNVDDTRIEPPETPAPVFAVRAFKHAIFGTPQPPPTVAPTRLAKKRKISPKRDTTDAPALPAPNDTEATNFSPTKQGILMTPGTVRGKKKEVTFGAQVVDNADKKPSRTGLPSNYPGKFPSPWTPKTVELGTDKLPKTKLTEALYEAKAADAGLKRHKTRAKDDADITLDIIEPRSESGRYWKEQYIVLGKEAEERIGKLTAKYKLCKEHARRKDDEASELRRQLEASSKRHQKREQELEKQIKEMREQLRVRMAENAKTYTEISLLKKQVDNSTSETSVTKLKRAIQRMDGSSIWIDEGDQDDDESAKTRTYLQAAVVQSRGEQARSTRHHKERRLEHKGGSIARQDSVFTPDDRLDPDNSELERSPTPRASRDASKPLRRILADMSPNVSSTPPLPSYFSEADFEKITAKAMTPMSDTEQSKPKVRSPTHREAMADAAASLSRKRDFDVLDDLAPMSALSLQAEQPVTPQPPSRVRSSRPRSTPHSSSRSHKRSAATSKASGTSAGLDADRAKAAKERLEARRAKKHIRAR